MSDDIDYLTLEDADLEKMSNYTDIRTNIEYLDRVCTRILNEGKVDRATMESVERICPESISPDYPVAAYMQDPSEVYVEQSLESIDYGKLALGVAAGIAVTASIYLIYKRMKDKKYGSDSEKIIKETKRTSENIQDDVKSQNNTEKSRNSSAHGKPMDEPRNNNGGEGRDRDNTNPRDRTEMQRRSPRGEDKETKFTLILHENKYDLRVYTKGKSSSVGKGWFNLYRKPVDSSRRATINIHRCALEVARNSSKTSESILAAIEEYIKQLDIVRDRPSEDHSNAFISFKENDPVFRDVKRGPDRHSTSFPEEWSSVHIINEFESLVFKESTTGASSLQEILSSVTGTDEFIDFILNEYVADPLSSSAEFAMYMNGTQDAVKDAIRNKLKDIKLNKSDIENHGIKMTRPGNLTMLKHFTDYIQSCYVNISASVKFIDHYESFLKQMLICVKKIHKDINDRK